MTATQQTNLITAAVDFAVELQKLQTVENTLEVPNDMSTVRVDKDGTKKVLAVVGKRYKVVDHRDVIKSFSETLASAELTATVDHRVYRNGARIYSRFLLDDTVDIPLSDNTTKVARPFFTLTNSHDGALRIGFLVGAQIDGAIYYADIGCRHSCATVKLFKDTLNNIDVPVLTLDCDVVDPTVTTEEEMREKLERFFELLEDR